jgi:hypothetical protein
MGNRPELSLTEDLQVYHVDSESEYYTGYSSLLTMIRLYMK